MQTEIPNPANLYSKLHRIQSLFLGASRVHADMEEEQIAETCYWILSPGDPDYLNKARHNLNLGKSRDDREYLSFLKQTLIPGLAIVDGEVRKSASPTFREEVRKSASPTFREEVRKSASPTFREEVRKSASPTFREEVRKKIILRKRDRRIVAAIVAIEDPELAAIVGDGCPWTEVRRKVIQYLHERHLQSTEIGKRTLIRIDDRLKGLLDGRKEAGVNISIHELLALIDLRRNRAKVP
ncbi:MAG: hypothetical protein ACYCOU_06405 [Sulfobacillus sp.]